MCLSEANFGIVGESQGYPGGDLCQSFNEIVAGCAGGR